MTKKDLAAQMAAKADISISQALNMIDLVVQTIGENLVAEGDNITIRGFGAFEVKKAGPRSGRNLRTSERVIIPSKLRIKFRPYVQPEV